MRTSQQTANLTKSKTPTSWKDIESGRKSFNLGMQSDLLLDEKVVLNQILGMANVPQIPVNNVYDETTKNAVKKFQITYNIATGSSLAEDGILGKNTYKAWQMVKENQLSFLMQASNHTAKIKKAFNQLKLPSRPSREAIATNNAENSYYQVDNRQMYYQNTTYDYNKYESGNCINPLSLPFAIVGNTLQALGDTLHVSTCHCHHDDDER